MTWTDILNIIGNIASIITVIGGVYGLCNWIKQQNTKVQINVYLFYTCTIKDLQMLII